MDCYRYNVKYLSSDYTFEIIDGAKNNLIRTKREFQSEYLDDELNKYPAFLERDPQTTLKLSNLDKKVKKKKRAGFDLDGASKSQILNQSPTIQRAKKQNLKRMLTKLINEN